MYAIKRFESSEEKKNSFKNTIRQKSEILLLKKDPGSRVEWPWKWKAQKAEHIHLRSVDTVPKSKISKHARALYRKRLLLPRQKRVGAPKLYKHFSSQEVHDKTNYEMADLVGEFLFQNCKSIDTSKTESIKGLSLVLLDNMLANLADIGLPITENKAELGWEYVMGNMLKLGLPKTVIDRVSKRMEETNKSSPAITAMNVTRPLLSDLTITAAEVEMQQEIQSLVEENEVYESRPEDSPFEGSVKWLIDLDRKDQYAKDKEIEKTHLDYTRLLP